MIGRVVAAVAVAVGAGAAGWAGLPGTAHAVGGPCGPYKPGANGVIQTFCDGPARLNLTIGSKSYAMKGGACSDSSMGYNLNIGVVSTGEARPKPDYVGLLTPTHAGAFRGATLSATVGGKTQIVMKNSGTVGPKGGAFSGATMAGEKVSATFTC